MNCKTCGIITKNCRRQYCSTCYLFSRIAKAPPPIQKLADQIDTGWFSFDLLLALYTKCVELWADPKFRLAMTVATNANIVAIENNKALMVLERNPKNTGMLFGFPGGSRKSGEHPLITALREWYEETGIPIHDFTGVDILYNLKGGKTQTADIICLIYVKNFATNPHGDHTSLHREMMSLTYIKQSKDSVWFQIVEKKLSLYDANRPEDKFRIRQCTYHEFDEVMRRATTLQNNISV